MKNKNSIITSLAALAAFTIAGPASADVVATAATGANGFFTVSTTDLADASQGGTVSLSSGSAVYGSAEAKVIDGGVYNGVGTNQTPETLTPAAGSTLTLNLATSLYGWNLSSIVVLTGVGPTDQFERSDHSYTIALSTDGINFGTPFINVNDTTTASQEFGGEVQMTIADNASAPLGTGIKAVRFVFANAVGPGENMYREIDVLGVASVPEPSDPFLAWINATWPSLSDKTPAGDPDNDGIANLVEYVLQGGDPSVSTTNILPTLDASGANFVFTYFRRTAATGTTQTFEYGDNLSGWTPVLIPGGAGVVVTPNTPSAGIDEVKITVAKGANTKLFGRLQVVK